MQRVSILFFIVIFFSCTKQNKYRVEDALYKCQVEYYKNQGIDILAQTDSLQSFYVRQGVLKDYSGKSIIALLKKIKAENDLNLPVYNGDLKPTNILEFNYISNDCNNLDTNFLEEELQRLTNLGSELGQISDISPTSVATAILKVLDENDVEHPYYKGRLLTVFYFLNDAEKGVKATLPPLPNGESQHKPNKENVFEIAVQTNTSKLIVNGDTILLSELASKAKNFIIIKGSEGIFSLKRERATDYGYYKKIPDIIISVYKEVRNEYAIKNYGKPYNKLSKEEQEIVKEIYPQKISEAEPKE